jgi:hypothetical protein
MVVPVSSDISTFGPGNKSLPLGAVHLKFPIIIAASSFRNFKFKNRTRIKMFLASF